MNDKGNSYYNNNNENNIKAVSSNNKHAHHVDGREEIVVEAEVANDVEQVVQEEAQRAVQRALWQAQSQRPLAIVVASERTILQSNTKSSTRQVQDDEDEERIFCGRSRRTAVFLVVAVVVTVVAITGGIIVASSLLHANEKALSTPVSSEAPTVVPPSLAPTIVNLMDLLYPAVHQKMENLSAAQYNATLWIMEKDTFAWKEVPSSEVLERHALATLYFGLLNNNDDGTNWSEIVPSSGSSWLSNASHCEWESVTCSSSSTNNSINETSNDHASVISLDLSTLDLRGSIPAEIGRLSNLETLVLSNNRITGSLPTDLYYGLTKLTHLDLVGNLLTSFGTEIGRLTTLRALHAGRNLFPSIPSAIGNLQALRVFQMTAGQLNSTVPVELGRLSNLVRLNLAGNFLWGRIPDLSALRNLVDLTLANNTLSGQIPPVGALTALTWLKLNDNRLTGSLPDGFDRVPALEHFNANNNQIGSTIPPELFLGLSSLTTLRLENNLLSGPLPTANNLSRLWSLELNGNRLTSLPSDLGTMTSLTHLKLAYNQLNTTIPTELGRLNLRLFDVRGNQLYGSVPESLNRWSQIRKAYFSSNNITGGLEHLFCGKTFLQDLEADCFEFVCNCCTDCGQE